jgi:hypothetical protein
MTILTENDFQLERSLIIKNHIYLLYNKYEANYEFLSWKKKGRKRINKYFKRPDRIVPLDQYSTVEIRGHYFRAPFKPEIYLTYVYGENWETPIKTNVKSIYFDRKFFKIPILKRLYISSPEFLKKIYRNIRDYFKKSKK